MSTSHLNIEHLTEIPEHIRNNYRTRARYDFLDNLKVGEGAISVTAPRDQKPERIRGGMISYATNHGMKIKTRKEGDKIYVWRVS